MLQIRHLLALFLIAVAFTACSEDDPATMTHYFNPVWTPDGSTIVAGYLQGSTGPVDAASPVSSGDLAVLDFETRALRIVSMPDVQTIHALYSFDPSGTALAFAQNGSIRLYDLNGNVLLNYVPTEGGNPEMMVFSNTGNSFVWIGGTPGSYMLNQVTYDAATWTVLSEFPMMTLPSTARVIGLSMTGQRSVAVRYDNGTIKEYDFNSDELNSFTVEPFASENPWQQRMMYFSRPNDRRLYLRDAGGLHQLNLNSGTSQQLLFGNVVDMDVSESRSSMVYETGTGDTWIATTDATPLTRIGPQNLMPRFSPAANGIATVQRLDVYTDSLHVFLLR